MNVQVDIQTASSEPAPDEGDIRNWITTTLKGRTTRDAVEISVRVVDASEMSTLNETVNLSLAAAALVWPWPDVTQVAVFLQPSFIQVHQKNGLSRPWPLPQAPGLPRRNWHFSISFGKPRAASGKCHGVRPEVDPD